MYDLEYTDEFLKYWKKIPESIKSQIIKKLKELKEERTFKHLRYSVDFFVLKIGQYRICFKTEKYKRILFFVGNHKEYEKWYNDAKK